MASFRLGSAPFWTDEIFSLLFARGSLHSLVAQAAADVHPPFYFFLLHWWLKMFGESELAVRALSLLPLALSLWLIYQIASYVFNRKVALLTAFLCAFSPVIVLYSRMARYYSLVACLMLAALFLLMKLRGKETFFRWAAYLAVTILLFYTDYPSSAYLIILSGGLLIYFVLAEKKASTIIFRWIGIIAVSVLAYLPWLTKMLATSGAMFTKHVDVDRNLGATALVLKLIFPLYSFIFGETLFPWHYPLIALGLLAFIASLIIAVCYCRENNNNGLPITAGLVGGTVIINALLLSYFAKTHSFIYYPRTIIFAVYLLLMLVACGIVAGGKRVGAVLLVALLLVNGYSLLNVSRLQEYFNPFYLIPWKTVAGDIMRQARTTDRIFSDDPSLKYYLRSAEDTAGLTEIMNKDKVERFWLVLSGKDSREEQLFQERILRITEERYRPTTRLKYLPLDRRFVSLKAKLQKRQSYLYKLTVTLYSK